MRYADHRRRNWLDDSLHYNNEQRCVTPLHWLQLMRMRVCWIANNVICIYVHEQWVNKSRRRLRTHVSSFTSSFTLQVKMYHMMSHGSVTLTYALGKTPYCRESDTDNAEQRAISIRRVYWSPISITASQHDTSRLVGRGLAVTSREFVCDWSPINPRELTGVWTVLTCRDVLSCRWQVTHMSLQWNEGLKPL